MPPGLTEDEIKEVVEQGYKDKAIEKQESELVHGALNFDDIVIRTVMTPRTKMFKLNSKMMLFEALPEINKSGFSRIPVFADNTDQIVGIVHVRDVLKKLESEKSFVYLKRPISPKKLNKVVKLGEPGIKKKERYVRYYPHQKHASHILGGVNIDNKGCLLYTSPSPRD